MLDPAATERTPQFNDYNADSYHAEKQDIVLGLPEQAAACGFPLRAALVIGPMGPMWTYHVVAFLGDGADVKLNSLVMPHARITGKGTATLPPQQVEDAFESIQKHPLVREGFPPGAGDDFSWHLVLARYEGKKPRYFSAVLDPVRSAPGEPELFEHVNELLEAISSTYVHGQGRTSEP